jgi:Tol biopolymer transport system component/tRNA A-37 threonylcarbamoyl transferase component Bud32
MQIGLSALTDALGDRYRIERELGAGGMATVYLAEDLRHQRKVAIKVLRPELAAVIGAERFLREIQTIAALQHPHILGLIDSGEVAGLAWYAMPFIEGESLRDRLRREKQLPIADAVRIAGEVASALDYAHRHGVIHRDIKPENVLLHDGQALVADFGIALAVSRTGGDRMTETGMSLGTPQYMSPEQAMGERDIGPRSDIYALGAVLYEMLAGEPPFTGPSAQAIVAKVMTEDAPSLTAQRRTVPPQVDAAVRVALEKLPADRFPTARAFAEALADPSRQGAVMVAAGARAAARWSLSAAVVMAGLALWGWVRPARTSEGQGAPLRLEVALPDSARPADGITISPDGTTIVYSAGHAGDTRLYRLQTTTGSLDPIPGSRGGFAPRISPDGRRVAFRRSAPPKAEIVILPIEGGTPRVVSRREPWYFGLISWLDDNSLLVDNETGVQRVPLDGGPPVQLTTPDTAQGEYAHMYPAPIGPDGILFSIVPKGGWTDVRAFRIAAVGPDGGTPVILTRGRHARFLAPNHLIVDRGDGTIVSFPFDPTRLRLAGEATTILAGPHGGHNSNSGLFDVAATGRLVIEYGDDSKSAEVVWVDRRGGAGAFGDGWRANFIDLALSPDGSRVAASLYTPWSEEIQVRDAATESIVRITDSVAMARSPAWAPDGRTLFYSAFRAEGSEVRQVAPGTVEPPRILLRTPFGAATLSPAPAPDGRTLYFSQQPAGTRQGAEIASIAVAGAAPPRPVVLSPGMTPVPSPDGRWLAYGLLDNTGMVTLMVRSTDPARGETWQVAAGMQSDPRWSRDGRALYYVAGDSMRVATIAGGGTFQVSARQTLFGLGALEPIFDVAPDGRFIMVRRLPASAFGLDLLLLDNWVGVGS